MRRSDLRSEEGWVLVTAVVLMGIMIVVALASFSVADTGQHRAREQRQRETALNLTEGVMYGQGLALANSWPGNATIAAGMPTSCTQAGAAVGQQQFCPDPGSYAQANAATGDAPNFTNVDAAQDVQWTTKVRDNGGGANGGLRYAYVSANADAAQSGTGVNDAPYTCAAPCDWDANGDNQIWVQARTVVHGRPRNVVSLLRREQLSEPFRANGVVAGSLQTSNNGNKTIIDSSGSQVVVRCTTTTAACTDYQVNKDQITTSQPNNAITRDSGYPSAMSADQLARLKVAAKTANPPTYYTSCPSSLAGAVVYIDVPATTNCADANSATYNSAASPGIVVMPRGTLGDLKSTYYGILYLGNQQGSSAVVLSLGANALVVGGVSIDGAGRLNAGQASGNQPTVRFDPNAFVRVVSFGTTGLVQNTWRELPPT